MLLTGPDVRPWHEAVDWRRVAATGHTFAWCPATTGIARVDQHFRANWAGMRAAGLIPGALHTLTSSYVGRAEARHFINVLDDRLTGSLTAVAVKVEGRLDGQSVATIDRLSEFASEFARLADGHPLLIRTSWQWWARRDPAGRGAHISPYLWHATPRRGPLWAMYGGWIAPTIWQHIPSGQCPGIVGLCGLNIFYGDPTTLATLLGAQRPSDPERDVARPGLGRRIVDGLTAWRRRAA